MEIILLVIIYFGIIIAVQKLFKWSLNHFGAFSRIRAWIKTPKVKRMYSHVRLFLNIIIFFIIVSSPNSFWISAIVLGVLMGILNSFD